MEYTEEEPLGEVCLIVDFDGFHMPPKFFAREVAYVPLTRGPDVTVGSFRTDTSKMPIPNQRARDQCDWVTRNLHGMSIIPDRDEEDLVPIAKWKIQVLKIYRYYKTFDKTVVAYKGGHHEKDFLNSYDIPSINIEEFGCPKFDEIKYENPDCFITCGWHNHCEPWIRHKVHCPKAEVAAFKWWCDTYLN